MSGTKDEGRVIALLPEDLPRRLHDGPFRFRGNRVFNRLFHFFYRICGQHVPIAALYRIFKPEFPYTRVAPLQVLGKRSGQTLIEVAVATMISAITSVAVFSVILSSFVSEQKADKKELAAMLLKDAQQTLQAFVSAVPSEAAYTINAGGLWAADTSGRWALYGLPDPGFRHDISSLMNGTALQVNPSVNCVWTGNCSFTYVVIDSPSANCINGILGAGTNNACKTVVFSLIFAN